MRWWSSVLFFNGFIITIIVNVVCYETKHFAFLMIIVVWMYSGTQISGTSLSRKKRRKWPRYVCSAWSQMWVPLCLLLLHIVMTWGDHTLFSRVAYLCGWHSSVWPFKWKLFPMLYCSLQYVLEGGLTFLSLWMKPPVSDHW